MDEILRRLQGMYDGDAADGSRDGPPSEEDAELESMLRTRQLLSARSPRRPRQETIEALVRAAVAAKSVRRAPERGARSLLRSAQGRPPRALALGVALVVVAVLVVGRVTHQDVATDRYELALEAGPPSVDDEVERDEPARAAEGMLDFSPGAVSEVNAASANAVHRHSTKTAPAGRVAHLEPETEVVDEVLAWDQSDDVWDLYRRVEQLSSVSPEDASWRASVQRPLVAPVGLAQTRYVSTR